MRSAMTLSPDADGVFDVLMGLVRRGLGGFRFAHPDWPDAARDLVRRCRLRTELARAA